MPAIGEIVITQNILGEVSVSFSLSAHDWQKIEESAAWWEVEQLLAEAQKQNIRLRHQAEKAELETVDCNNQKKKLHQTRLKIRFSEPKMEEDDARTV